MRKRTGGLLWRLWVSTMGAATAAGFLCWFGGLLIVPLIADVLDIAIMPGDHYHDSYLRLVAIVGVVTFAYVWLVVFAETREKSSEQPPG
jgi:hypothetical protein